MKQITSLQNSKVKLVKRLRSKRGRQQERRFVIDYERDLRRALNQGLELDFLLHCPQVAGDVSVESLEAADIYQISPQILNQLSYRENSSGIAAVLQSPTAKGLPELQEAAVGYAVLLVALQKPGNIGALLRTADASQLDAVILVDVSLDLYNPNIIRSSTGSCFLDNIYQLGSDAAIAYCQRQGFQLVAADAQGGASLYDMDFRQRTAIALGTEDQGLSPAWETNCDQLVRIPMNGRLADSLNVAVSGAIFMYEVLRQRHFCPAQAGKAKSGQCPQ